MKRYKRIFVIVLDSLGIGAMPDAPEYGDAGVDTFGHILRAVGPLSIPHLQKLGMLNLHPDGGGQQEQGHHDRPLGDDGAEGGETI